MDHQNVSDNEEEVLVYAEFEDCVNVEKFRSIHVLGVSEKNPVIQMDDTFFTGKFKNPLGTYMFFEEDPSPPCVDPLFDKPPEKNVKYICKTRKVLAMEHAYVTPKEGSEQNLEGASQESDDDIRIVKFKTVHDALDKFKEEFFINSTSEDPTRSNTQNSVENECNQLQSLSKQIKPQIANHQKRRKTIENIFQEINRDYVQIKKKDRKCNNQILHAVLEELLSIMKEKDELFCSLKPKLNFLGSYFDGLRVGQPSEYDLNVILKIPVNYGKIKLDATSTLYDHTSIIMSSEFRRLSKIPTTADKGFSKTKLWCDKNYRFSVTKFSQWMQSVVDCAIATLPQDTNNKRIICVKNKKYIISAKRSGPANTVTIIRQDKDNDLIDIDLVPTFEFKLPKKPLNSKVLFEKAEITKLNEYFAVPKPSGNDYSWRLSFPFQERYYMRDKCNFKSALKLLKLLRDRQGFKDLASYYIKTIFLWETTKRNDDFWKKSLSFLVVHMLKELQKCLDKGEIQNFWCPEFNLIEGKINIETCRNWANRLSRIIKELEYNSNIYDPNIKKHFINK